MKKSFFCIPKVCIIVGFLMFTAVFGLVAQDLSAYQKQLFISGSDTLPYRVLLPKNYDPTKAYPLVLFLHGSGERGNDNERQLIFGAKLFLNDSLRQLYPAVVVFPQCPGRYSWNNGKKMTNNPQMRIFPDSVVQNKAQNLLTGLIIRLKSDYRLDEKRFYVGGLSMGGMGTFEIVNQHPDMFAAAFPICGGANPAIASRISKSSWWIFHGEIDDIVSVDCSKQMYSALKEIHADVKLTLYPNVKHDSWINTLQEPELLSWLFSKKLTVERVK